MTTTALTDAELVKLLHEAARDLDDIISKSFDDGGDWTCHKSARREIERVAGNLRALIKPAKKWVF